MDLDIEALQPLDGLLQGRRLVLAGLGDRMINKEQAIPNAFMASSAGHRFWDFVLADILRQPPPDQFHVRALPSQNRTFLVPVTLSHCQICLHYFVPCLVR